MPSKGVIKCNSCGKIMLKNSLKSHVNNKHNGDNVSTTLLSTENNLYEFTNSSKHRIPPQKIIREGHDDNDDNDINENYEDINDTKPINQFNYQPFQQQEKVIVKNFRDLETIQNVKQLNQKITDVINNFNGHLKKLYNEKANKNDILHLHRQIKDMKYSIEGIKRTLTEQHKTIHNIKNVYKHTKKTDTNYSKKVQQKIDELVKKQSGGNNNTEEVLQNVNVNITAQKIAIERSYKIINNMTTDINKIKTRLDAHDTRINSLEQTNDILLKKMLSEDDVINIVKKILEAKGQPIKKEEITEIMNEKDNINEVKNENKEEINEEVKGGKPLNSFKDEINVVINKMRLTKKDELNKTSIKKIKNVIEKHNKMGHLEQIETFIKSLPQRKTKKNKKGAVVRKELNTIVKNIIVR
jgi:hypothetical protein